MRAPALLCTLAAALPHAPLALSPMGDGGPADGPTSEGQMPLMRGEAPDMPPAEWDDDVPIKGASAQGWATTDVDRHWQSRDAAPVSSMSAVEYSSESLSLSRTGNISHTYHIDPHLLADMPDANGFCGTPDQIHDCGFSWLAPVCTDSSSSDCVRGVCICTSKNGCDKPVCDSTNFECRSHKPNPLVACKDGCISRHGTGWGCWHPCNMQHEVEDYGAQATRVRTIRATGVCGNAMTVDRASNTAVQGDPNLLKDITDASGFCGSSELVSSCGFSHVDDVCTGPDCYKGVCVCTAKDGCLQPQCKPYETTCPAGLAQCRDGKGCLAVPGTGWGCWHPCNLEHKVEEYGHQAGVVQAIRNSGNCTRLGVHIVTNASTVTLSPIASASGTGAADSPDDAAKEEVFRDDDLTPGLDAGIMLRAGAYPGYFGESTVNAGGASRRRADKFRQPIVDTTAHIQEAKEGWYSSMQGSAETGEQGRKTMYGLIIFLVLIVTLLWLRNKRKAAAEKESAAS